MVVDECNFYVIEYGMDGFCLEIKINVEKLGK